MPTLRPAHLRASAFEELLAEADARFPNETGGVLLGWVVDGITHVRQVVGPGPAAVHGPTGFHPDSDWQEDVIALAYETSGRRVTYLGDWHTHPRGTPRPSRLDRLTMRTIARYAPARCPQPLMLIAAGEPGLWTLGVHLRLLGRRPVGSRTLRLRLTIDET
jgi:integrative and conjugative element protein (TIGR02256 family)